MRFIIDQNLPDRFHLWAGEDYTHVKYLNQAWTDAQIYQYAQEHDLIIITQDSDFADRKNFTKPIVKIIHIGLKNARMRQLYATLTPIWEDVVSRLTDNDYVFINERGQIMSDLI